MIKVIASDLDGTLLGNNHKIAPQTRQAVERACHAGIRFIVTTGRSFHGALVAVKDTGLTCDFLTSSGAEIRDNQHRIQSCSPLPYAACHDILSLTQSYPVDVVCFSQDYDFHFCQPGKSPNVFMPSFAPHYLKWLPNFIKNALFHPPKRAEMRIFSDLETIMEQHIPIYKIDILSHDLEVIALLNSKLQTDTRLAVSSGFPNDLEITAAEVEKGPILQKYIQSLGYTMDEVMVVGDSMNDYSMLSMDFGMTVAMGNALPEVKAVAKYVTKTNQEFGVAWMIDQILQQQKQPVSL